MTVKTHDNKSRILARIQEEVRQKIEGDEGRTNANASPEDKLIYIRY